MHGPSRPLSISGILSDWDDGLLVVPTQSVCPAMHLAPIRILEHPALLWRFGTATMWAKIWKSVKYALHRCEGYRKCVGRGTGAGRKGAAPSEKNAGVGKCG